jgi:hypothetical protein
MEQPVMPVTKLSTVLMNAGRECWLALTEDESAVVGRGETPAEAVEEAKRSGVQDPILIWAPKKWTPSIFK